MSRSQRSGRGESSAGCTGLRRVLKGSGAGELPSGRHENRRIRPKPERAACAGAELLQSCLTLCDPMDCSLPGSSVHGSLQARILEWVAMPCTRGPSQARDHTHVSHV